MDELQRSIYVDKFRLALHTQKGTAFQDWFVRLAGHAFGADFEEVRPYGSYGDLKCDGRRISSGSVFQCYAPETMKEADLIAKIDEDFHGARAHWDGNMQEWVFVHNDGRGLPPNAVQHLDTLREAHAPLQISTWSEPELLALAMGLDLSSLQALFGFAASIAIVDRLVLSDLMPIIDALQRQDSPANPPLTPPSPEKLEKNALSEESGLFLRIGRRKSNLVDTFFRKSPRPDLGERIAEPSGRAMPSSRRSTFQPTRSSSTFRTMPASTVSRSGKARLWRSSPTSSTVATSSKIQSPPWRHYDPSNQTCPPGSCADRRRRRSAGNSQAADDDVAVVG